VRDELAELKPKTANWSEFLAALADIDDPPERTTSDAACAFGNAPEGGFADLQDALATIEERTGRIERALEDMGGRR
jgi:hypothetical protein